MGETFQQGLRRILAENGYEMTPEEVRESIIASVVERCTGVCQVCKQRRELRWGVCFECAATESQEGK